jgi:uncharacterized protein YecE (DUF72 family)
MAVYPVGSLGVMAARAIFSGEIPFSLAAEIRKQVEDSKAEREEPVLHHVHEEVVVAVVLAEADLPVSGGDRRGQHRARA